MPRIQKQISLLLPVSDVVSWDFDRFPEKCRVGFTIKTADNTNWPFSAEYIGSHTFSSGLVEHALLITSEGEMKISFSLRLNMNPDFYEGKELAQRIITTAIDKYIENQKWLNSILDEIAKESKNLVLTPDGKLIPFAT